MSRNDPLSREATADSRMPNVEWRKDWRRPNPKSVQSVSSVVESQLGAYSLLNLRRGRHLPNTRDADAVFEFGMLNKSPGSEVERLVTFLSL
jgi:hypothetical protein